MRTENLTTVVMPLPNPLLSHVCQPAYLPVHSMILFVVVQDGMWSLRSLRTTRLRSCRTRGYSTTTTLQSYWSRIYSMTMLRTSPIFRVYPTLLHLQSIATLKHTTVPTNSMWMPRCRPVERRRTKCPETRTDIAGVDAGTDEADGCDRNGFGNPPQPRLRHTLRRVPTSTKTNEERPVPFATFSAKSKPRGSSINGRGLEQKMQIKMIYSNEK